MLRNYWSPDPNLIGEKTHKSWTFQGFKSALYFVVDCGAQQRLQTANCLCHPLSSPLVFAVRKEELKMKSRRETHYSDFTGLVKTEISFNSMLKKWSRIRKAMLRLDSKRF